MKLQLALLILCCALLGNVVCWAGGTNSIFLRMSNMVNTLEKQETLSSEEAQAWQNKIQDLRQKVDERIKQNGGGLNQFQDKDLFDEINQQGDQLFKLYQPSKN